MGEENSVQWAIDLMTDKTFYKPTFLNKYRGEMGLIAGIISAPILWNKFRNVPWYTGSPQLFAYFVLPASCCAILASRAVLRTQDKRDARVIDYIKLHPERFPEPENRQYKDIFQPWTPVR